MLASRGVQPRHELPRLLPGALLVANLVLGLLQPATIDRHDSRLPRSLMVCTYRHASAARLRILCGLMHTSKTLLRNATTCVMVETQA